MSTDTTLRRRAGQRISGAVWGLLVMGAAALSAAAYSGYDIDLELAAIIVLGAFGGWLLLSAAVSGIGRKREVARATAPTVEEPAAPAPHAPTPVAPGPSASASDAPESHAPASASASDAPGTDAPASASADEGPDPLGTEDDKARERDKD